MLRDFFGRVLASLRVSVTDRGNLRCAYCMPEENYEWLPRQRLLNFEELTRLVDIVTEMGVCRIRPAGGAPLLRRNLDRLVRLLAANPLILDLAFTTDGVLLAEQAAALRNAGLNRVTINLNTLRPQRFLALTRRNDHGRGACRWCSVRRAAFHAGSPDARKRVLFLFRTFHAFSPMCRVPCILQFPAIDDGSSSFISSLAEYSRRPQQEAHARRRFWRRMGIPLPAKGV